MRKEKYYSILNYGCQMNESDAEHYAGQLEELGYARTEELVRADVILVNTCCIRESAELKILGKIGELKRVKAQHPGQIICVAGCMAQKDGAALVKKYPQIDLLLGTSYVNSFKQILQDYLEERKKACSPVWKYRAVSLKDSACGRVASAPGSPSCTAVIISVRTASCRTYGAGNGAAALRIF